MSEVYPIATKASRITVMSEQTIAAVIITSNRENIVGDAVASVCLFADAIVVVNLGITDNTLSVIAERFFRAPKVCPIDWDGTAGHARNVGLAFAAEHRFDWACILDTDERLTMPEDVREQLLALGGTSYVNAPHSSGTYLKPRFIRLPPQGKYVGVVHEAYVPPIPSPPSIGSFWELEKTVEQFRLRLHGDLEALQKVTRENPQDGRSWYYLGDTLYNLGLRGEAMMAFDRCRQVSQWDEEAAWACWRASQCCEWLRDHARGLGFAIMGLQIHAAIPELAWYAGFHCLRLGRRRDAHQWARMALAIAPVERVGFKFPPGMKEYPEDILKRTS